MKLSPGRTLGLFNKRSFRRGVSTQGPNTFRGCRRENDRWTSRRRNGLCHYPSEPEVLPVNSKGSRG
jgi:hypothetical protein